MPVLRPSMYTSPHGVTAKPSRASAAAASLPARPRLRRRHDRGRRAGAPLASGAATSRRRRLRRSRGWRRVGRGSRWPRPSDRHGAAPARSTSSGAAIRRPAAPPARHSARTGCAAEARPRRGAGGGAIASPYRRIDRRSNRPAACAAGRVCAAAAPKASRGPTSELRADPRTSPARSGNGRPDAWPAPARRSRSNAAGRLRLRLVGGPAEV